MRKITIQGLSSIGTSNGENSKALRMKRNLLGIFLVTFFLTSCHSGFTGSAFVVASDDSDTQISPDLSSVTSTSSLSWEDTPIMNPVSFGILIEIDPPYPKNLPENPCWIKSEESLRKFQKSFPELQNSHSDVFDSFDFSSFQYLCVTISGPSCGRSSYSVTGMYQTRDKKKIVLDYSYRKQPGTDETQDVTNGFLLIRTGRMDGEMSLVLRNMFYSGFMNSTTDEETFEWSNEKMDSSRYFFHSEEKGTIEDY